MKGCDCHECQALCRHEPGWFLPGEVERSAAHLHITVDEFCRQFCEELNIDQTVVLAPKFVSKQRACIFYEEGLCRIHEVKPHECRKVFGCEPKRRHKRVRELILRQWQKGRV